jgi:two-component system NtrC family sensor kinase
MRQTRLVAWRRLPGVDMVVISSVARAAVLRAWATTMLPYLCVGLFVMVALLSMTLLALRHARLANAAEQQAEVERNRRRQAEDAIRQGQKMEALGKLTGGVAHDFNNLLAVILGSAELAKRRPPDKAQRLLDNIIHAGQRGATLTRQLLSFSRAQALQPKVLDPHAELPRMLGLLRPSLPNDIAIETDLAQDVWPVEIDPTEWEIALLNIAANARDAMPDGGRLRVEASNLRIARGAIAGAPELEGDFIRIALHDTGPGIPADVAARAFEPFYTTKDVGRGSGLGLSQVYGFARQAGGAVTIGTGEAQPDADQSGTIVTLFLPRSRKPLDAPSHPPAAEQGPETAVRRVLVVEDNPEVAAITIEMIQSLGYEVVHADRARAALDMLTQPGPSFDLLLSDVVMPDGMNGLELAMIVRRRLPNLPIILMSGYNDTFAQPQADFRILRKPLPVQQLGQAIAAEVGAWPRIVVDNTAGGISSGHSRSG